MKGFEKILGQINKLNEPFSGFELFNKEGQFKVIGKGGSSIVYDMVSKKNKDKHYAMKIIDIRGDFEALRKSKEIFKIQKMLSEKSKYIIEIMNIRLVRVKKLPLQLIQEMKQKLPFQQN